MQPVNAHSLVTRARSGGYAVPAFNTNGATYAITRAALEAAQELSSPLILQVYQPNIAYRGFRYFVNQARTLCEDLGITIPVALQLDHGKSADVCRGAMDAGLTAVMIDGSHEVFEVNVRLTRQVRALAQPRGVTVEAEIGYVAGNEPAPVSRLGRVPIADTPAFTPGKTDVAEAVAFAAATAVDMLAVAVGTVHGVYRRQPDIDFALVEALNRALNVPLVQHGTGGVSLEDLGRLARSGMAKINFGEPFRYNAIRYFAELTDSMEHLWHAWRIDEAVKDRLKADMKAIIQALGADGKAP
ncbi:MAG: class II fructose-bisphosphate aldolase [Lentisphaeria bacterium]|nr:class II fructose-bisphosphate aldolase [Lentisphaeria bacterium]